jgi:hypothetical protein
MKKSNKDEFETFTDAVKQVLSISHEELKARELQWKKQKQKGKKAKASPASRAANDRA